MGFLDSHIIIEHLSFTCKNGAMNFLKIFSNKRRKDRLGTIKPSSLRDSLVVLINYFNQQDIKYALVGGIALAARGVVRGTRDIDFLIDQQDALKVHELMSKLGFSSLNQGISVISYLLERLRVDFLIARRERGHSILKRAQLVSVSKNVMAKIVTLEDLICLKLQAVVEDPQRGRDRLDIIELLRTQHAHVSIDKIREEAINLGAEGEFNEILSNID
ncbi:MAG: nucleotidyltransferase [Deltaproteobacteria bacterium]|nr:nucleotidyltransferase [Deltaproteobacteria bacterium]